MPHNIYLELLFSVGIVGTLLVFGCGICFYVNGRAKSVNYQTSELFWKLFAQLLLIYVFFRGLTELRLGFKVWGILAIALGLLVAIRVKARTRPDNLQNS